MAVSPRLDGPFFCLGCATTERTRSATHVLTSRAYHHLTGVVISLVLGHSGTPRSIVLRSYAVPSSPSLLLYPFPVACSILRSCVLGFAYPGYKTFKVLKGGDVLAQREWLKYWCVLGLAAVLSLLTDLLVGTFLPGYGLLKLGIVVALVSPTIRGYARVWAVVEPHLAAQEGAIDGAVARAMDATASARSTGAARASAAMAQGRAAAVRQAEGVKKRAAAGRGGGGAAPKSGATM